MAFFGSKRAQGAFEYLLLAAGVLLIVVVAITILRGNVLSSAQNQIQAQANAIGVENNLTIALCGVYLPSGVTYIANASNPNSSAHCWDPASGTFLPDKLQ